MSTHLQCRNASVRNSIKVTQMDPAKDPKTEKPTGGWKKSNTLIVAPNETFDVYVDSNQRRVTIEEIPT